MNGRAVLAAVLAASAALCAYEPFFEDFDGASPTYFSYGSGGHQAPFTHVSGTESPDEPGTTVMTLTIDTADAAGAWQGVNFQTPNLLGFGTYAARVKTPTAKDSAMNQPLAGAVVGFFTYRHDADDNGNGVLENSEIDFEWLIADPRVIYLTAWVDVNDDPWRVTKINRTIDLSRGRILQTVYENLDGTRGSFTDELSNSPSTIAAIPDYDASARFYVYGFDWATDRIRWWMIDPASPADTIVLWDYRGDVKYVTQQPAYLMFNFWHTDSWSVEGVPSSTQRPRHPFAAQFDWVSYTPAPEYDVAVRRPVAAAPEFSASFAGRGPSRSRARAETAWRSSTPPGRGWRGFPPPTGRSSSECPARASIW